MYIFHAGSFSKLYRVSTFPLLPHNLGLFALGSRWLAIAGLSSQPRTAPTIAQSVGSMAMTAGGGLYSGLAYSYMAASSFLSGTSGAAAADEGSVSAITASVMSPSAASVSGAGGGAGVSDPNSASLFPVVTETSLTTAYVADGCSGVVEVYNLMAAQKQSKGILKATSTGNTAHRAENDGLEVLSQLAAWRAFDEPLAFLQWNSSGTMVSWDCRTAAMSPNSVG